MKKNLFAFALIALCSVSAVAQESKPVAAADPVVLRVGTTEVRQSAFEAALASLPAEYQMYVAQQGKRAFADDYVRMMVLAQDAVSRKLDKEPKVAAQLALVRENTLAAALVKSIEEATVPTEPEITARYESKKGSLETVDARHILVAFKGSPAAKPENELTEEQAKAKAESIKAKLAGGADFAELAKAESDDTFSGAQGGSLGAFGRGQMVPEFETAAFSNEVGKVGEVVRTQFGFHVIEVTRRGAPALDEVRSDLTDELRNELVQKKVAELTGKVSVTMDDAYFGAAPAAAAPAQPAKVE
ncbi:MAG: peptidylprolyl isomerase [Acidobacteria bacterium]|nr:peptidylprolyl isomerase [Acidobacteriota bacterium]